MSGASLCERFTTRPRSSMRCASAAQLVANARRPSVPKNSRFRAICLCRSSSYLESSQPPSEVVGGAGGDGSVAAYGVEDRGTRGGDGGGNSAGGGVASSGTLVSGESPISSDSCLSSSRLSARLTWFLRFVVSLLNSPLSFLERPGPSPALG
eukprot:5707052-Prymnesium_polylepis.1